MAKPYRVYWDACTWISYINEERSITMKDGTVENRFAMCEAVLKRAEKGEIEIVTSAFTLAEVCKSADAKTTNLSKLPYFLDHDFILVIPVNKNIGIKAQKILCSGLSAMKPPDGTHLASAQRANAKEFHTFDADLLAKDGQINSDDGQTIKCCRPGEGQTGPNLFSASKT